MNQSRKIHLFNCFFTVKVNGYHIKSPIGGLSLKWIKGGANEVSLRQAQRNFKIYGASEKRCKDNVEDPFLRGGYEKDEDFKPL
ncbi:CPCC family cysteine-rich protein [Bacillus sp. SA1-12]|uniref:CPCC family cysteine-rich protein n=1 Tax=Bacillus sp. SA1-12 TaxID=1455638 RepID=UPI000697CF6E|nr:CPCC family cysteine-rich protein [Bacillus sp. SA1-12]